MSNNKRLRQRLHGFLARGFCFLKRFDSLCPEVGMFTQNYWQTRLTWKRPVTDGGKCRSYRLFKLINYYHKTNTRGCPTRNTAAPGPYSPLFSCSGYPAPNPWRAPSPSGWHLWSSADLIWHNEPCSLFVAATHYVFLLAEKLKDPVRSFWFEL